MKCLYFEERLIYSKDKSFGYRKITRESRFMDLQTFRESIK